MDLITPVIRTDRLVLRAVRWEDAPALARVLSDPVAMRFYPRPFDRTDVGRWIEWNRRNYRRLGFGLWAMVLVGAGEVIGDCGITLQRIEGVPTEEIGYHLQRRHGGRGLVTEAARACRDHLFKVLGKKRVVSWMPPHHHASRRVAERIGMRIEKETINNVGNWAVVYSMSRREYDRLPPSAPASTTSPGTP